MSSIRLFILDALDRRGDMHGHQLRLLAEEERVQLWTDISVGALYGALKRLGADGLIAEVRLEREGNFPERQVHGITDAGRASLAELREQGLLDVHVKPDPFDLALTRLDPARLDDVDGLFAERLAALRDRLAEIEANNARAEPHLTIAEKHALDHRAHRLLSEIAWHEALVARLPEILADERSRRLQPGI